MELRIIFEKYESVRRYSTVGQQTQGLPLQMNANSIIDLKMFGSRNRKYCIIISKKEKN
jgi:hypothetical protein